MGCMTIFGALVDCPTSIVVVLTSPEESKPKPFVVGMSQLLPYCAFLLA